MHDNHENGKITYFMNVLADYSINSAVCQQIASAISLAASEISADADDLD